MASKLFLVDSFEKYKSDGTIDLDTDTLKVALTTNPTPSYSARDNSTAYVVGDIRIPATRNGHRYRCATSGTSGGTPPSFPTIDGASVLDGNAVWTEYGGEFDDKTIWGDVSSAELVNGNGYSTGGATLSGSSVTYTGKTTKWDASDVVWSTLSKTFRWAWIYKSGTVGSVVNPLIAYMLLDDTPADVTISGVDFTLIFNSSGIVNWTR